MKENSTMQLVKRLFNYLYLLRRLEGYLKDRIGGFYFLLYVFAYWVVQENVLWSWYNINYINSENEIVDKRHHFKMKELTWFQVGSFWEDET